jgi:hypothetical protein
MPFETLSYTAIISLNDFPKRWYPLVHLYDPDLPLFPLYYFHRTKPGLIRPSQRDRVFGYVESISLTKSGADIKILCNKDFCDDLNKDYLVLVENEVKERFGLVNPVNFEDIIGFFPPPLDYANKIIEELWYKIVSPAFDNKLPFGRLFDEVFGLARLVASFNPPGGRKSELIQTHYFLSRFGEKISSSGDNQQVDFFLLPSVEELLDLSNPLSSFPKYQKLVDFACRFNKLFCEQVSIGNQSVSKFKNPSGGQLNTKKLNGLFNNPNIPINLKSTAYECFNTFDKGPLRTVIFLLMLDDLRNNRIDYRSGAGIELGSIYDSMKGFYQSPKVIHIYAQQAFGETGAMPVDTWIQTLMQWPLRIFPEHGGTKLSFLFQNSQNLGKLERLLWVTAQARKVHSSICDNALWCTKYASNKKPRGANPLACKICNLTIRNVCPAYNRIKSKTIVFNKKSYRRDQFLIATSSNNNNDLGQSFISCIGESIYHNIYDDFSPSDNPGEYSPFSGLTTLNGTMTVEDFINKY